MAGIRRIERIYANRSIYESGLLLKETIQDISLPGIVAGAAMPVRTTENTYALMDVGRSSEIKTECFVLNVANSSIAGDDRPIMREMLASTAGGRISFPQVLQPDGGQPKPCHSLPSFDRGRVTDEHATYPLKGPQRLAPVLVQTVQTSKEGDAVSLVTGVQFKVDHNARVIQMCDLGQFGDVKDDVCTTQSYDEHIQLSFVHGPTGGGTLAYNLLDRVEDIKVRVGPKSEQEDGGSADKTIVRRRTAGYDRDTGDVLALCEFESLDAADQCERIHHGAFDPRDKHSIVTASELIARNRIGGKRLVMRFYHYDHYGNLDRYISPVASEGFFIDRTLTFDPFLHLIEMQDETNYCHVVPGAGAVDKCPSGSKSALGGLLAVKADVDWRHAVATTQVDVNHNAIHTPIDPAGRPSSAFVSWSEAWAPAPDCSRAGECSELTAASGSLKPGIQWGKLVDYAFRVGRARDHNGQSTSIARITRYEDASLYKATGSGAVVQGTASFETDQHYDQFGRLLRTIAPADICVLGLESPAGAACDPNRRATHTASGIIRFDAVYRETESFLPIAVNGLPPIETASVGPQPNEDLSTSPHSHIVADGFGRPLNARLSDGNSYAFSYRIAGIDAVTVRHRTVVRDARCIPTAMDRDERGHIRAVHEFSNAGADTDFNAHSVGSSFDPAQKLAIVANGWVKDINYANPNQQVFACSMGEADIRNVASPIIATPLEDPLRDGGARRRRSSTTYDYDPLGQLTAVHLPQANAATARPPVTPGSKVISIAYDALGRRTAIEDPDRGVDLLSYDMASNLICRRSGPPVSESGFANAQSILRAERNRTAAAAGARLQGEDQCLEPNDTAKELISRVVKSDYLYDRPSSVDFVYPQPLERDRKNVAIAYGHSQQEDWTLNRVGREARLVDVTQTMTTNAYHPLGIAEKITRSIKSLDRDGQQISDIGEVTAVDTHDTWGLLRRSVISGRFKGLKSDGSNDDNPAKALSVNEAVKYRYTTAGQINEVRVGTPCWIAPGGGENCTGVAPGIGLVTDAAFDERGNMLRLAYGNGVVTRQAFDGASNRLVSSASRIGVRCVEYGPGDDCSTSAPPILFQNLRYQYDAAGNVAAYENAPRYADLCATLPPGSACPQISKRHAGLQGLLVMGSSNQLSYDERGRLKGARKGLGVYGHGPIKWAMDERAFRDAQLEDINIAEDFAFTDSHLLTGIKRSIGMRIGGVGASAGDRTTTIRHHYASNRPTAPSATDVKQGGRLETQKYEPDDFGRTAKVECTGCLTTPAKGESKYVARRFTWDPDDTLVKVDRRVEPPYREARSEKEKKTRYYAEVDQSYDHAGNRAIKRWTKAQKGPDGAESSLVRETVYADSRLTVTRKPGEKPEALLHIFAGSSRLASKWVGSESVFTYHAQLPTGTISDVVYARGDDRTTARLHQQLEYAAFGELLVAREKEMEQLNRAATDKEKIDNVLYRFDGKEFDEETNLSYFGGRHYDQRFGLWLSPDPTMDQYLEGQPNLGVFDAKNLASYSFGWGNPVAHIDYGGRATYVVANLNSLQPGPNENWVAGKIVEAISTYTGSHIGVAIINEGNGLNRLFDPSGSFRPNVVDPMSGKLTAELSVRGESDVFQDDEARLNFKNYIKYQIKTDGPNVTVFRLKLEEKVAGTLEKALAEAISTVDDTPKGLFFSAECALRCSEALKESGILKGIDSYRRPKGLANALRALGPQRVEEIPATKFLGGQE